MRYIKAFLLGMKEFRQSFTSYPPSFNERRVYDKGRAFRHWINFHRYEEK